MIKKRLQKSRKKAEKIWKTQHSGSGRVELSVEEEYGEAGEDRSRGGGAERKEREGMARAWRERGRKEGEGKGTGHSGRAGRAGSKAGWLPACSLGLRDVPHLGAWESVKGVREFESVGTDEIITGRGDLH